MSQNASQPFCPRCGYDQSGELAIWNTTTSLECPLTHTCTECGLDFAWRDILNPIYSRQLTMFEHAQLRRPASFILTWWKSARPWSLWSWLRMQHRIVPVRIAGFAALGFTLTHLLLILTSIAVALAMRIGVGFAPRRMWLRETVASAAADAAYPLGAEWHYSSSLNSISQFIAPMELIALLTFLIVPLTFSLLPITLRRARVRRAHLARIWAYALVWMPLAFGAPVLLKQTLTLADFIVRFAGRTWPWFSIALDQVYRNSSWFTLAAAGIWCVLWWSLAARRYLRLPHAPAIGLVMTALAMLLVTLAMFIYPGGTWLTWNL